MVPRRRGSPNKSAGSTEAVFIAGQTFFFDLTGFRGIRGLQSKLVSLGGCVEPVLSKNVDYVITNRNDEITTSKTRSSRETSTGLGPQKSRHARGRPMVKNAKNNGNMGILQRAAELGIQITHVKVVLQWIDDLTSQHLLRKSSIRNPIATRTTTARQMRGYTTKNVPRSCKPMQCLRTCPRLELGTCPLDEAPPMLTRATVHQKQTKLKKKVTTRPGKSTKRPTPVKRRSTKTVRKSITPNRTPDTCASPVDWEPSPSPVKDKRVQKNELRKRLKQIQRRLSFSGFDDEPVRSKIISTPRKRRQSKVYSPSYPIALSLLTTPKKRKLESSGSYTEIAPPTMTRRVKNGKLKKPIKDNKRRRKSSIVIKDLMTRLDDAKASRQDTSSSGVQTHTKTRKVKKTRPLPRRTCVIKYQRRYAGTKNTEPTLQQVARQLKRELAATTPVICTMSLRNGKTKVSQL